MNNNRETAALYKSEEGRRRVRELYESVLARWPLPLERLRVATAWGETAVLAFGPEGGPRPPLMVLHGTLSNSSMWLGEAEILARDRRVFALDIPGEPGMSAEARLEWRSPEESGAWLAEVVAALALGEHEVLGLSIGAWIGLSYATRRPAGLRSLALLCPSGIGRTRPSFMLKGILAMARGRRGLEALSRSLYGDLPVPEEAIRIGTLLAESTNARMEEPRQFTDEELAGIEARLFLAVGTKDALLSSKESAKRLGRIKPEAEILVLPGYGHGLIGLGPRAVEFLER